MSILWDARHKLVKYWNSKLAQERFWNLTYFALASVYYMIIMPLSMQFDRHLKSFPALLSVVFFFFLLFFFVVFFFFFFFFFVYVLIC